MIQPDQLPSMATAKPARPTSRAASRTRETIFFIRCLLFRPLDPSSYTERIAFRMKRAKARHLLADLYRAALDGADPGEGVRRALARKRIARALAGAREVGVFAAGKAAAAMLDAARGRFDRGLAVLPRGHPGPRERGVEILFSAHPEPDRSSVEAARAAIRFFRSFGSDDAILALISGGASSLVALPRPGLTLERKRRAVKRLIAAGASISEVNRLRTPPLGGERGASRRRDAGPRDLARALGRPRGPAGDGRIRAHDPPPPRRPRARRRVQPRGTRRRGPGGPARRPLAPPREPAAVGRGEPGGGGLRPRRVAPPSRRGLPRRRRDDSDPVGKGRPRGPQSRARARGGARARGRRALRCRAPGRGLGRPGRIARTPRGPSRTGGRSLARPAAVSTPPARSPDTTRTRSSRPWATSS